MEADLKEQYREILETYRKCYDERVLYRASLLSKELMRRKVDPNEIIGMHFEILEEITKKTSHKSINSLLCEIVPQFLPSFSGTPCD